MTRIVIAISLTALLVSCRQREQEPAGQPDPPTIQQITGTWSYRYANDSLTTGTSSFMDSGNFQHSWSSTRSGSSYTNTTRGTFHLDGDYLIELVTQHSDTNARVPYVLRSRILHLDEQRLHLGVVDSESRVKDISVYTKQGR